MVNSAAPRATAPTLADDERSRLERLRRLGYLLDNSIAVPGTGYRIGLEALIGLVPGLGDLVGGGFSAWIVLQAARLGAPPSTPFVLLIWSVPPDFVLRPAALRLARRPVADA